MGAAPLEGVLNVNFAQIFCCCPYHDITTTRPRHITMCFALSHIRIRRHTHSRFVESTVCPYSSISDISYVHVQYSAVVKRNKISKHNWIVTSNLSKTLKHWMDFVSYFLWCIFSLSTKQNWYMSSLKETKIQTLNHTVLYRRKNSAKKNVGTQLNTSKAKIYASDLDICSSSE